MRSARRHDQRIGLRATLTSYSCVHFPKKRKKERKKETIKQCSSVLRGQLDERARAGEDYASTLATSLFCGNFSARAKRTTPIYTCTSINLGAYVMYTNAHTDYTHITGDVHIRTRNVCAAVPREKRAVASRDTRKETEICI